MYDEKSGQDGMHITGNTNLPSVLCAARIDSRGMTQYKWGRFVDRAGNYNTPFVERKDGIYKVYHRIGHENYIPTVTPQGGEALMVSILEVKAEYFTFKLFNRGGGLAASAFNYQCIGSNES